MAISVHTDRQVTQYIDKQPHPQREICRKLRDLIFDIVPDIDERMKWGVPSYAGAQCYIVALKDHVNLGFSIKRLPKEEIAQLQGSGRTMRVIEFHSEDDIDRSRIKRLLTRVVGRQASMP